jgi:hypothetical protein
MIRKFLVMTGLAVIPFLTFAQLDIDGKTEVLPAKKSGEKNSHPFTILYAATSDIPFGVKLLYCKSFGAFASFKSDFDLTRNHYDVTVGAVKSLGKAADFYLGGGLDLGDYEEGWDGWGPDYWRNTPCLLTESGIIIKIRSFAIDLGIGIALDEYVDDKKDAQSSVYANFGLGFNF